MRSTDLGDPKKVFDAGDEGAFELPPGMLFAEFEEIERVFVLDREFGLSPQRGWDRLVEIGLAEQGFS